jgi:hypothetical protein
MRKEAGDGMEDAVRQKEGSERKEKKKRRNKKKKGRRQME